MKNFYVSTRLAVVRVLLLTAIFLAFPAAAAADNDPAAADNDPAAADNDPEAAAIRELVLTEVTDTTAGTKTSTKVKFAYDVDFAAYFDNNEHPNTGLRSSMTIFNARLTPSIGLDVEQGSSSHTVMLGVDIMKDFGDGPDVESGEEYSSRYATADLFREMILYYRLKFHFNKTEMRISAGVFPKNLSPAQYSDVFFSDSVQYYRPNYEGLLFSFYRPRSYYEVGIDWIGKPGTFDRERFMVFSYGSSQINQWLSLGYQGYLYHYANSGTVEGVVDNALFNFWACFDITHKVPMQRLAFTAGYLQAAQQDRKQIGGYVMPGGGQITIEARKWGLGILNNTYIGTNLMPYYSNDDPGGYKYGNSLYFGNAYYRLFDDGDTDTIGMYDRLDIYYEPYICDFLTFRLAMGFHFTQDGYAGCNQKITLLFDLNKLINAR